ncbi:MAG TPA: hypothetical protein VF806_06545 [Anaerolineaceae bacterium]
MLILPPQEVPPAGKKSALFRIMEAVERIGQLSVIVIPFFYRLPLLRQASVDALAVMVLAIGFYYSGWVRYATKGHRFVLLFAPFLGIPLPMAISPVIYFLAAAIFLRAWPLVIAAVVLGIGHLYISQAEWNRCRSGDDFTLSTQRRI